MTTRSSGIFFAGHPVVAADGLQPPDFVFVVEGNAVGLIGAVLREKRAKTQHALARGVNVGQDENDDVLLADAAAVFLLAVLGLLQLDHRVGCEHARV